MNLQVLLRFLKNFSIIWSKFSSEVGFWGWCFRLRQLADDSWFHSNEFVSRGWFFWVVGGFFFHLIIFAIRGGQSAMHWLTVNLRVARALNCPLLGKGAIPVGFVSLWIPYLTYPNPSIKSLRLSFTISGSWFILPQIFKLSSYFNLHTTFRPKWI